MATIKDIKIMRNRGNRPENNVIYVDHVWLVEKGEPYDVLQFSINELERSYYWKSIICTPCGLLEKELYRIAEQHAKKITDNEINDYKSFLDIGDEYGWD